MSTNIEQSERLTGRIKWFNSKAGYGFITVCDGDKAGSDIFVHYTSVRVDNTHYKYLVQGEYVEFNLVKSDSETHEFHAVDVSGIKGGELMCQTQRQMNLRPVLSRPRRVYVTREEGGDAKPVRKPAPRRESADVDGEGFVKVGRNKPKPSGAAR
jgi:CspA family cold shock protein